MVNIAIGATAFEMPDWLPLDTEESVLGTEWHQEAAEALAGMLEEVARRRGASWGLCRNIALLESGGHYADGRPYDPRPDIMILAQPLPWGGAASVRLADSGVPLFVMEVASKSTVGNDVGPKSQLYGAIGVPDYLVFDAVGDVLSAPLLAWHMGPNGYTPWMPESDGWWWSRALEVAFRPAHPFIEVRDRDGRRIAPPREAYADAERLERELAEAHRRIAEMEGRTSGQ